MQQRQTSISSGKTVVDDDSCYSGNNEGEEVAGRKCKLPENQDCKIENQKIKLKSRLRNFHQFCKHCGRR